MDFEFLAELCAATGPPGGEDEVRELVAGRLIALGGSCQTDALGNLIASFEGEGPRVLLQAHMDEVGFLVSKIEEAGFIRFMAQGGVDPRVVGGQRMVVHGRRRVEGVVGSVPPHLTTDAKDSREKVTPLAEMFIDPGLPPGEVKELVRVGDLITFAPQFWQTDTALFAKALDDRVGLFVLMEALSRVEKFGCQLFMAASVQEEVGLKGAGPAAFSVKPDIALAIEGTVASDMPGVNLPANLRATRQGRGPEIRLTDRGMTADRALCAFLADLAGRRGIDHQVIVKNLGSTDAARMQVAGRGTRATAVSVPIRYIHAPIGLANKADIEQTVALLTAFIEEAANFPGL